MRMKKGSPALKQELWRALHAPLQLKWEAHLFTGKTVAFLSVRDGLVFGRMPGAFGGRLPSCLGGDDGSGAAMGG